MNFLKNFFNDDGAIVGLCGFGMTKPQRGERPVMNETFFNTFEFEKVFETNFDKNIFLL